jgi:hypothetical protein
MAKVVRAGRLYSYKSVRRGGKVTSVYRGAGQFAECLELLDGAARSRREQGREAERAWLKAAMAEEAAVVDYYRQVEATVTAALSDAGYRRHNRGEWRRRREAQRA